MENKELDMIKQEISEKADADYIKAEIAMLKADIANLHANLAHLSVEISKK